LPIALLNFPLPHGHGSLRPRFFLYLGVDIDLESPVVG
jgi:hypothetical protein